MRIALLSNINMDLLVPRLKDSLAEYGMNSEFYVSGFNQYIQEMLNPDSVLREEDFNAAILFIDGEEIFKEILSEPFRFKSGDIDRAIDTEIKNLCLQMESVLRSKTAPVFFVNTIFIRKPNILGALDYNADPDLSGLHEKFNSRIREVKISEKVVIVDFSSLVSRHGHETFYDDRLWYLGRIKFSSTGLQLLSELYSSYIQAYLGKSKKVLILDLDNTLWGGIVGEDGADGVKLGDEGIGRAYLDFQRLIKSLKYKGILLAICSKNNLDDLKEVFEKNRFMYLKESDFVDIKVNWENKIENIRQISIALNLGLDSFVFVDDNPFERQMVSSELPQVTIPEFPKDPADLCQWFIDLSLKHFNSIAITGEDKARTAIYRADSRRKELEKSSATLDDFYKSLDMTAIIRVNSLDHFKRIAQLTQRTNQFNLTTRRYSENEILDFMRNNDKMVLSLELNDRFGSNGIVGVLIAKMDGKSSYIDTFLLSCRVIGRMVEDSFISYLSEILRTKGIVNLIGEYIPAKKNSLVKELYKRFGFELSESREDGSDIWRFDLSKGNLSGNKWIKVEADRDNIGGGKNWN